MTQDQSPEVAAAKMQPALECIGKWAEEHYMEINLDAGKTEALVISLDPRETAGKSQPLLKIYDKQVNYSKNPVSLGTTLDPQLNFTEHTKQAKKKMQNRTKILSSLSGKDWGLTAKDLRQLYNGYVRPSGTYGVGVFFPFVSDPSAASI